MTHGDPPGLSLVSFSWPWRARKVAWSCSNLPESPRRTRAECRARVRWLDPLASAAQYLHREASTSVTSNTRQASGGASGRVFLHIVGLFFPARPRSWLRRWNWRNSVLCACEGGKLYSPSRKCFCVGTGVGGGGEREAGGGSPQRVMRAAADRGRVWAINR